MPARQRHDRVEVRARDRHEREDERDEPGAGRDRVLEQLQPDVVRREPLGEDARADDDGDEEARADGLRSRAPGEIDGQLQQQRVADSGADEQQSSSCGISTSSSTV